MGCSLYQAVLDIARMAIVMLAAVALKCCMSLSLVVLHLAVCACMQVLEARRRELGRLRQAIPARVGMQVLICT